MNETIEGAGPLRRLVEAYATLLRILLGVSVLILLFPVTLQIISRFSALIPHYIWTEEMARFGLVWMVMIGAMLAVREGTHFVVDVFPLLTPRGNAKVELLAGVFVLAFALIFLIFGWEFTEFAFYRISEMAELPLWMIHVAWPLAGLSFLIFSAQRMLDAARLLRQPPEHHA
jgi:TRAP-type C4-dicarboxylate transport system permease small subunit